MDRAQPASAAVKPGPPLLRAPVPADGGRGDCDTTWAAALCPVLGGAPAALVVTAHHEQLQAGMQPCISGSFNSL